MKCPNCSGELVSKGGRFCPYCGTNLGNDINININKESFNRTEILDHGRIAEATADERKNKAVVVLRIVGFAVVLIIFICVFSMISRNNKANEQRKANEEAVRIAELNVHEQETVRLQAIEDEILQDIREEKYEQAIAKSKILVYTGDNKMSKKAWDEKRQELINTLAELIKRRQ